MQSFLLSNEFAISNVGGNLIFDSAAIMQRIYIDRAISQTDSSLRSE